MKSTIYSRRQVLGATRGCTTCSMPDAKYVHRDVQVTPGHRGGQQKVPPCSITCQHDVDVALVSRNSKQCQRISLLSHKHQDKLGKVAFEKLPNTNG
ncbi:hypothetical protein ACOSQ2_017274 [Xanthoceras sorbifolium]